MKKIPFFLSLMTIFIMTMAVANAAPEVTNVGKFKDYPALNQDNDQVPIVSDNISQVTQQVFKKKDNGVSSFKDAIQQINQATDATLKDNQVAQTSAGKNSASNTTTPKEVTGVYIGNQQVSENMTNRNTTDVAAPKDTVPVQIE